MLLSAIGASAFPVDTYAPASALARGKWVKISVAESGMHLIPTATLRQWGFSAPERVRIHGYGGAMLSDILSLENYTDDLPQVPAQLTARGLVFYAVGPMQVSMTDAGVLSHEVNPYSSYGYYFLTEASADDGPLPAVPSGGSPLESAAGCAVTTSYMLVHEQELVSPGQSGRIMVGEDFNATRSRTFNVAMTNRTEGTPVKVTTSFLANTSTAMSTLRFKINGEEMPVQASDRIATSKSDSGVWGAMTTTTKTATPQGDRLTLEIGFENPGVVKAANLDYFEVVYDRRLAGSFDYFTTSTAVCHAGAGDQSVHVWDVTDPLAVTQMQPGAQGAWRAPRAGVRHYAVWADGDAMPAPKLAGSVANQNLHGLAEVPDMVIITPDVYAAAARDIAAIHRSYEPEPLRVEVVSLNEVLNEFGSGAFDPGALRRFLKMLYDRGEASGSPLRYALMMGKGVCDNRQLTVVGRNVNQPMPLWVSSASLNESTSFSSDDYFALLGDNDGTQPGREDLDIAVGRIPATTAAEAAVAVSKIKQYLYSMPRDGWRTRLTILADDENQGVHMEQSEAMVANLFAGTSGSRMVVNKVYCDAFVRQNSTYPKAREVLFSNFSDGTSVFVFIGHGSPHALGSKTIVAPTDFRTNFHMRRLPFFYAATCSFLRWDSDITSEAEGLMFLPSGGMIACISALRPVYISLNGDLSAAFGTVLGEFDEEGKVHSIGELYRKSKNLLHNDVNRLRYVLMGDPALRLSMPSPTIEITGVNGSRPSAEEPVTVMARQQLEITGRVLQPDGTPMSDFNGMIYATLYDAEFSTVSHGYGEGTEYAFEQHGDMLFSVCGQVTDGQFAVSVQMPSAVADNYRPATLSLYACGSDSREMREAAGLTRNIYAYGYDDTTPDDTEPPVVHSLMLNGDSFTDGGNVDPSPMLIATISDNVGINLSSAGVGKKMTLTVDGNTTFSDLSRYFTPDAVPVQGAMSGTLAYSMSGLAPGPHEMKLRVWDTDGNFTDRTIGCNVVEGLAPEIYEVYTDASPARTEANFFVRHNRPDRMLKVKVTVYNLAGAPVWSASTEARSDMGVSAPLTWDLRDSGGKRVGRGIYIYRAEVTTEGSSVSTASRKLAVTNE